MALGLFISSLVICVVILWNYPKFSYYMAARNCKISIDWNEMTPNRVGGFVEIKIKVENWLITTFYLECFKP